MSIFYFAVFLFISANTTAQVTLTDCGVMIMAFTTPVGQSNSDVPRINCHVEKRSNDKRG